MFKNRKEAGELLSAKLQKYRHKALVFSIPRGGVVVGNILATTLEIHHYILVSKKIPAPNHPELAIGAVAPEGNIVLDKDLISNLGISEEYLGKETERISKEVNERLKKFVSEKPQIEGKTIILTDDGIATGDTIKAAIAYLRSKNPARIIVAVPVAPDDVTQKIRGVDELVVLETNKDFQAVGQFYKNFPQVTDEEVVSLLKNQDSY